MFLQNQISTNDAIIAPKTDSFLTFFSPRLKTNIVNAEILDKDEEFKKLDKTVWFVVSTYTTENEKRTIEKLLQEKNASEIQRFDFKGIQVIKFQRGNL